MKFRLITWLMVCVALLTSCGWRQKASKASELIRDGNNKELKEYLTLNPNLVKESKSDLVAKAVAFDNAEAVEVLLSFGANPNGLSDTPCPLIFAAQKGNAKIVRLLVASGANINIQEQSGDTSLHRACAWNQFQAARLLVDLGADPKLTNNYGKTAIEYIKSGEKEADELRTYIQSKLAESKSSPHNVKNSNGHENGGSSSAADQPEDVRRH